MKASAGKRVLMLLENNPYPQDGRVRREARALTAAGYRVAVICPRGKNQPLRERIDGVEAYRYPAPPDGDGLAGYLLEYGYAMLATLVISLGVFAIRGFDVIHAHNPPDMFVLIAGFYKLFGKQFVFDHHDLSPEMYHARLSGGGSALVYRALLFFERLTFRAVDHVIATNQSYKAVAMNRGAVPEDRVTVVRNGPDLSRVRPVSPDRALREKAGTLIGYVGLMGYQDGVDYLLRALSHLVNDLDREDFLCLIIGRGDALQSLQSLASELQLDPYVRFTGRIPDADLMRYLSTVDICVDPDPSNPFNDRSTMIKMTEYMAMGKPIVAFDLPEHRVTAGEAAVYASPNNELDFARQIQTLMDDPARRQAMGAAGRARIETKLAWSFQERHLLTAYAKLDLGKNGSGQISSGDDSA